MQNHTIWQSAIGGTDAGGTDTCLLPRARQRKRSVWQTRRQGQLQVPLRGWGEGPEVMCSTAASVKCQEGQAVSVSTSHRPVCGVLWRPHGVRRAERPGRPADHRRWHAGVQPRAGGRGGGRPLGRATRGRAARPCMLQRSASGMAGVPGVRSGAATSGRSSGAPVAPSGGRGARAARRGWTCAPSGGTRRGRRGDGARGRSTCARARRRPSRP